MGVTIDSENCSIDLGYGGFSNLRTKVAELTAPDIYNHYKKLEKGMFLTGTKKEAFFKDYNMEIQRLSEKYNGKKITYLISCMQVTVMEKWMSSIVNQSMKLLKAMMMKSAMGIAVDQIVRCLRILKNL